MLSVLEIEENLFLRNTYTRYHICLMRVFILFGGFKKNKNKKKSSVMCPPRYQV